MTDRNDIVYSEFVDHSIEVIYLNQPKKKNAIDAAMMDILTTKLEEADALSDLKVVVLRGAGDDFSSGGDLSQGAGGKPSPEMARETLRHYGKVIRAIRRIDKPVIAMVDGYAVGGAFAMTLACDLVVASDRALFMPAFCQIGVVPEMAMMKYLPELVGQQRAKEILFFGGKIASRRMYDLGLVNKVVTSASLETETMAIARSLAAMPSASIQITKGLMNSLADDDLEVCLGAELTASPFCTTTDSYARTMEKYAK